MSFSANVNRWCVGAKAEMSDLNKAIVLKLFSAVIADTPVLEGRLRGNWVLTSENPAIGEVEIEDPTGTKTTQKVMDFVRGLDGEKDFDLYLTNNLPYAYRIEYGGHSKVKAPAGMVRKNVIRITELLKSGAKV